MKKVEYLKMDYKQIESKQDDMDTLYKQFDNGNMWVIQFNEDVQLDEVGKVYLTAEQVKQIFPSKS